MGLFRKYKKLSAEPADETAVKREVLSVGHTPAMDTGEPSAMQVLSEMKKWRDATNEFMQKRLYNIEIRLTRLEKLFEKDGNN